MGQQQSGELGSDFQVEQHKRASQRLSIRLALKHNTETTDQTLSSTSTHGAMETSSLSIRSSRDFIDSNTSSPTTTTTTDEPSTFEQCLDIQTESVGVKTNESGETTKPTERRSTRRVFKSDEIPKHFSMMTSNTKRASVHFGNSRPMSICSLESLGYNGITKMISDKNLLLQFRNYCKTEYSEENLDLFLLSNQLLEECRRFQTSEKSNEEKRKSLNLTTSSNRAKVIKLVLSEFEFEERVLKKLEKALDKLLEKMEKERLEKRKSLVKSRRKNSEFLGIDRNIYKSNSNSGNNSGGSTHFLNFDEMADSFPSFGQSTLEGVNVGNKVKIQMEGIKKNNVLQQQLLSNELKRHSKKLNFASDTDTNMYLSGQLGGDESPTNVFSLEDPPRIQVAALLDDLRSESLVNLKDTYLRFFQQHVQNEVR